MPEEFKCEECGKTFDTKRGLHVHQSQAHPDMDKEEKEAEKKPEEKTETKKEKPEKKEKPKTTSDEAKTTTDPWKLATGVMIVLFCISLFFNIYSVPEGLFETEGLSSQGSQAAEEAGEEAANLIEDMLKTQGMSAQVSLLNASGTGSGVYKINLEISAQGRTQKQTSYMTEDKKLLLQQAEIIDMGQGATAEEIGKRGAEVIADMPQIKQSNISVEFNRSLGQVSGLYSLELVLSGKSQGQEISQALESYATKDGKYFFMQGTNVTEIKARIEQMKKLQGSLQRNNTGAPQ